MYHIQQVNEPNPTNLELQALLSAFNGVARMFETKKGGPLSLSKSQTSRLKYHLQAQYQK
jgi:hypothetical protein